LEDISEKKSTSSTAQIMKMWPERSLFISLRACYRTICFNCFIT